MKKFKSLTSRFGLFGVVLAVMAVAFSVFSCRPDYDLDKRFPKELGTSIYETLQKGFKGDDGKQYTFKYFVAIIDSLDDYKKILSKTGSKTLFVADDEAFEAFLKKCPLAGGREMRFDQLTKSQMRMIFNGSMLNNVYQVAALSNTEGPTIGDCMRRFSSADVYDSIRVMMPSEMPNTEYWKGVKSNPSGIVIFEDGTQKPLIIFADKYLKSHGIKPDDYDFLFNQGAYGNKPGRKEGEASINGVRIEFPNKKCFNGFIHVMEEVVYMLPSMAEYLAQSDTTQSSSYTTIVYSSILDRFSIPYYVRMPGTNTIPVPGLTTAINQREKIKDVLDRQVIDRTPALENALSAHGDSVFTKMYLSKRHQGTYTGDNVLQLTNKAGDTIQKSSLLKFDPGWNSYFVKSSANNEIAMQQNMAVMIVPTDSAITEWWLRGAGQEMRKKYGLEKYKNNPPTTPREVAEDMSAIDLNVIVKLVNNNMLTSLVSSVPSKFKDVLNDAQDRMFDDPEQAKKDISRVALCCNGAIYFTNYINTPTTYRSVAYPALVSAKLKVMDWAVEDETMGFNYYLNAMSTTYSLFLPIMDSASVNLKDRLAWVDPVSFSKHKLGAVATDSLYLIAFGYEDASHNVFADIYRCDTLGNPIGNPVKRNIRTLDFLRNRMTDLLDYHIIITSTADKKGVETDAVDVSNYAYFRTKGGGAVRFKKGGADPETEYGNMTVEGGWQIENNTAVKIIDRYDMKARARGNGVTYIIDKPLQTPRKSVYDVLSNSAKYPEFKKFFQVMFDADFFSDNPNNDGFARGSRYVMPYFSSYNYTIYVPQSATVQALFDNELLTEPSLIKDMKKHWSDVSKYLYNDRFKQDKDSANMAWADSMILLSRTIRHATALEPNTHADSVFADSASNGYNRLEQNYLNIELEKVRNFVKYHIQDNSVYINAEFNTGGSDYQTAYMRASDKQFIKLSVDAKSDGITIGDAKDPATDLPRHTRKVMTEKAGYWNIMCREYQFGKGYDPDPSKSTGTVGEVQGHRIETSSYAVIHLIDGPLCNGEVIF